MTETSANATTAEEQLVYQRTIFINPPVTRQWVDIKVFSLPAHVDDQSALALTIAHVRYRDSYAGTWDTDMVDKHGPYWLYAITPQTFAVADRADAGTVELHPRAARYVRHSINSRSAIRGRCALAQLCANV
ncbi:MAG: hypothetical protein WBB07_05000 [Mycobacterium sp.]